jgi:hypothetical protein
MNEKNEKKEKKEEKKEEAYECEECGATSDRPQQCCGQPMQETEL